MKDFSTGSLNGANLGGGVSVPPIDDAMNVALCFQDGAGASINCGGECAQGERLISATIADEALLPSVLAAASDACFQEPTVTDAADSSGFSTGAPDNSIDGYLHRAH